MRRFLMGDLSKTIPVTDLSDMARLAIVDVPRLAQHIRSANAKVSDGSQPPMTFDLSLRESTGSRSLNRLVCA